MNDLEPDLLIIDDFATERSPLELSVPSLCVLVPRLLPHAISLVVALVVVGCRVDGRTSVRVENTENAPLDSVWLFAIGDSAFLGALAAGQTAEARVSPRGESHLEFTHATSNGRILGDTYFEPGYRGPIRVQLQADSARVIEHASW